jgi:hypothetical protein
MRLRQWVNENSSVVTVGAVVVMIFSLGWIVQESLTRWHRSSGVPDVWFYDLGSGKLFRAKSTAVPPIDAPSGVLIDGEPAGVRARVFACGDCNDESKRFVGWLEKFSHQAKQAMVQGRTGQGQGYSSSSIGYIDGLLIRDEEGTRWLKASDPRAKEVFQMPRKRCPYPHVLNSCFPDS